MSINRSQITSWSWAQFAQYIQSQNGRILKNPKYSPLPVFGARGRWSYVDELKTCLNDFAQFPQFAKMPLDKRKRAAGTLSPDTDRWFGWMGAAGRFMSLVNNYPENLGQWLDAIPSQAPLTSTDITQYLHGMLRLPGVGLSTATRLLAMKRPDYCMPITTTNYQKLQLVFGQFCPRLRLSNKSANEIHDVAGQYVTFLSQIWSAPWWNAPVPQNPPWEHDIWLGRVAMLDTIFYDPEG
ncbi:hypothetical protein [Sulfobacillus thermosulfidooxidans]|uniref:hypothetical protein n=1 Tax=Sulfobacillus thermosulfidooxidans TaxID=28034 RepID=UPI00031CCD4A|nr:hypothetical protein [Sulfobacillus thermosulfidooxidans]